MQFPNLRSRLGHGLFFLVACGLVASNRHCFAQGNLRESLERLDVNQNGEIDPDEITPLARPYLERIARVRRLSLYRSNEISDFQEAARIYYAIQNGASDDRVRARPEVTVRGFRPDDEAPLVPAFGLAEIKYPYTPDDVDEAEETLARSDRNGDGFIDRREARWARWDSRDPFEMDLNGDGKLSRMELVQRYARRRMLDDAGDELVQRARRVGNGIEPSRPQRRGERDDEGRSLWRRNGTNYWLAGSLMERFDENRNGRLDQGEAVDLNISFGQLDVDRDGEISRTELFEYTSALQAEAGDTGEGLPGWFFELDVDRDGQVAMHEFAPESEWSLEKHNEFDTFDLNADGLLTSQEVLRAVAVVGGSYQNERAEVLPPHRTVISEIEVAGDFPIDKLTVEMSITHSNTGFLDAYLTGPNGERVELFTDVGGSGDHFDQTTFDDEAATPITKAKPPFEGTYRPEAVDKKQPGLKQFRGTGVQGVWQLVIRGTRSDRFGMLHRWGLKVIPLEYDPLQFDHAAASHDATDDSTVNGEETPASTGKQQATKVDKSTFFERMKSELIPDDDDQ